MQVASFSGSNSIKSERFIIYSIETGQPLAEVTPDEPAEGQLWTAFSPDGSMFCSWFVFETHVISAALTTAAGFLIRTEV
jgi:hypothetical protein